MKTGGILPTTTLRFRTKSLASNEVDQFITDVCLALSLVQGRKINWIHHATYGPRRAFQCAVFGQLCLIPSHSALKLTPLEAEKAVPAIKRFREIFDADNRIINAWLDARSETDYLEGRTLKSVVVVEALISLTRHKDGTIAKTLHNPKTWKQFYQTVVTGLPAEAADSLTLANWNRLNERSFRDVLASVCDHHAITLASEDIGIFSRIRNALVHRFNYDYSIRLPSHWNIPNHPQASQHFFVSELVDRIILQLFGLKK